VLRHLPNHREAINLLLQKFSRSGTLFLAKDWKFEVDEENDAVCTGIRGDNGDWQVMAIASDDDDAVLMLSLFPQKCPVHKRAPLSELSATMGRRFRTITGTSPGKKSWRKMCGCFMSP